MASYCLAIVCRFGLSRPIVVYSTSTNPVLCWIPTMAFYNPTMDRRGGHVYLKSSSTSSWKYPLLPSRNKLPFKPKITLPLNLKHSIKSSLSRTQPNYLNLSLPVKHLKMSTSSSPPSKKRDHENEPLDTDLDGRFRTPSLPAQLY
jgi:hypothetical protein